MRLFLITAMLIVFMNWSDAATVKDTIPDGMTYPADPVGANCFPEPCKQYKTEKILLYKNKDKNDPKYGNYDTILLQATLSLLSYNKKDDTYMMEFEFGDKIWIADNYSDKKEVYAHTELADKPHSKIILTGKFVRHRWKDRPKGNPNDKNLFMLSLDKEGISLTAQHTIPVIITLY